MTAEPNTSRISASRWLWLFPITYLIHVAEEFWGGEGYSAHLMKTKGVSMSPTRFLAVQAIGTALMAAGIILAKRFRFPNMMVVILGAIVLGNALTHSISASRRQAYEPGLVSAILIWMPLGLFSLIYFRRFVLNQTRFWIAVIVGIGVNVVIGVITMRGGKLF
jgi:hypothetical protein